MKDLLTAKLGWGSLTFLLAATFAVFIVAHLVITDMLGVTVAGVPGSVYVEFFTQG